MSDMQGTTLVDAVTRSMQAKEGASTALTALAAIAEQLEMFETAARLGQAHTGLLSETFKLIVIGRFKNGKSTLLNALMGGTATAVQLNGHQGPMVVDDLPATARLTFVRYSEQPYVKACRIDDKTEDWTFQRYLAESTLGGYSEEENQRRFEDIKYFEMGYPARLCRAGVEVFDSPGLDEHASRSWVTREASATCDAAIMVYRSDVLMGESEVMDADRLAAQGTKVFTVVNLYHGRVVDDRLRGFVWDKGITQKGGEKWDGQDLTAQDIYFVDAKQGCDARYGGDPRGLRDSGLLDFEQRLGEFLANERQHVHLEKFITYADQVAANIDTHIGERSAAAQADQQQLRQKYEQLQKPLQELRKRPERLARIVNHFQAEAHDALVASFQQAVEQIRNDLPDHLAATALPSQRAMLAVFRAGALAREVTDEVNNFCNARLDDWGTHDAEPLMAALLERLRQEIDSEIAQIDREFQQIRMDLTGWQFQTEASGPLVKRPERIIWAGLGLLFGDASAAITGGLAGWRGGAAGIAGAITMHVLLAIVGVTALPIVGPLMLLAALGPGVIIGGAALVKRAKDLAAKAADPVLAELAAGAKPMLEEKVGKDFGLIAQTVETEVGAMIAEEERHLENLVRITEADQDERDRLLERLSVNAAAVAEHRQALQQGLVTAKQT